MYTFLLQSSNTVVKGEPDDGEDDVEQDYEENINAMNKVNVLLQKNCQVLYVKHVNLKLGMQKVDNANET